MKSFLLAITISLSISLVRGLLESERQCPTFNTLDLGRKHVFASSTCGDNDSSSQYCYGSPTIQCNTCDDEDEVNVRNVIDGNLTSHWISRPGVTTANLTVDLLRPTRVTFLILSTSSNLSSKLPAKWEIHRSTDNGTTFIPWIYLATSSSPCPDGIDSDGEPDDNQVACHDISANDNDFLVPISLVNNRDLARCGEDMSFIYATHIRLVFLALDNEEMVNSSQIFYAVTELTIDGYCECNGYADQCSPINDTGLYQCNCLNGTCGQHCEQCCPLYNNAPYAAHDSGCVECNCSGNAESCEYNETLGMGVCISCKNNTTGINCEQCLPQYRLDSVSGLCIPCQCNENGTVDDGQCNIHGQCNCKEGYVFGPKCDHCPDGTFHDRGSCDDCSCPKNSSSGIQLPCDPFSGQCACPPNTVGLHCDMCANGTWDLDIDVGCKPCNCNIMGTIGHDCNGSTGQCRCRDSYTGIDCSMCENAYYQADGKCVPCNCHADGSHSLNCNSTTGKCACKEHVEGQKCDQCEEGYYNITAENGCLSCSCDGNGSISHVCDNITGQCNCQLGNAGRTCMGCETGYYIDMQTTLCLLCNCSESGSTTNSCNEDGQCDCKEGVLGDKCDRCDYGYWGFTSNGCKECNCFRDGTDGMHICNTTNGQCICNKGITGTKCERCEGMSHYIIINGTCNACTGCSENLIDDLLILVNQTQVAIDLLYNENTNRFDRLRNKTMSVIRKVMQWSNNVTVSLCRLQTDAHCKSVIEMPSIFRNYSRRFERLVELESFFPKLTDDVEDAVKLTYETFVALSMFETNVDIANNNTKAALDKATQLLSEATEKLKDVEQSFNDSEIVLVTITERNANFNNINITVNRELKDAKMRDNVSKSFLHNRTMENIRVNNLSTQLEMLQEILQHIHSISVNVSTTVNNTIIYNSNLNSNITRLQMILNTTTILNNTIGITLNQTWEEYEDVNAMWTEAKELLENVSDIINTLNMTDLRCAINETDLFNEGLEVVQVLVENANNHSADLRENSLLVINESFWLKFGRDIFENKSARINFTAGNLNIQNARNAAQDAIRQISESNLTSLKMDAIQLNSTTDLLSHQVVALSDNIKEKRDEAANISKNVFKFTTTVMSKFMDVTTLQNEITTLNETVKKIVLGSINSSLLESKDLVDVIVKTADQVDTKISNIEANINDTETNINFTSSSIAGINMTDANLTTLNTNVASSIENFTVDIGDLMDKTKNMISEIDDIIQNLFDIHQEISLMNQRLRLTGGNGKEPFVSLQPPPGRTLTDAVQYETIELFFRSNEIKNNTLLFYAGPAKAKDDKILQQNDYMALLLQKALDGSNELKLIHKLSGDVDAQQLVLRGSNFKEVVENQVYIARVGSTFTLALRNGDRSQQDSLSFSNGSSLFTGTNQTAFYIGGKPQDIELPSLVDSSSHFSGVALLVLYNSQIWSLWDIRDSFSANFTVTPEKSDLVGRLFDDTFALSFTGDGYLFTESLSSRRSDNILVIKIKPLSTEGLVMFAYDKQASLEVHYRSGNLVIIFNGSESQRSIKSPPGGIVTVTIRIFPFAILVQFDMKNPQVLVNTRETFSDFTKMKSWFGGINNDARQLRINQTQSFFGCIGLTLNNREIGTIRDHFIKYYVNSVTQKRLSLECLNAQYAHSASFNGNGSIEFDASSFPVDSTIILNNNFTSFSFEFVASNPNAGLLNADTKSGSLSIILMNHSIHVIIHNKNSGEERHLNSNHQLELGTLHFFLLYLNFMDTDAGYQLFIDDYLYDKVDGFKNEWKLDVFTSPESPKLILGAVDDTFFKGCMKNFAIQFRTIGFLSSKLSGTSGVTYHKCDILESPREQPLLAIAAAEPTTDQCPPPKKNFTRLEGIQSCHVSNLTGDYNFTVRAIPERPNGLLLAVTNSTDLIYAIGTKERKGLYYANNMTDEFSSDCPTLIMVNIVSRGNTAMIISNASVNVTQSGPLNLYIGGLPKNAIIDNTISFLQCSECDCPPRFLGQLDVQEIDLNHLVNSTEHSICELN